MEDKKTVKLHGLYLNGKKYYRGQTITLDIETKENTALEELTREVFKDAVFFEEEVSVEEAEEIFRRRR